MNLHIRPVCNNDVDDLVRLSLLAWAPVFSSFKQILGPKIYPIIYPDWRTTQREEVETVCEDGEKTIVWVAEVDGIVVGFLAYKLHNKDKTGEVHLLAVHPEYQNRGIGTELNNFALKKMKESGMKMAVVGTGGDPSHAPARKSYEKAGYTALPLVRYLRTYRYRLQADTRMIGSLYLLNILGQGQRRAVLLTASGQNRRLCGGCCRV